MQFDKLTVRAVTEPVEVQSNDFGFWIGSALKGRSLKSDIFLIIPFKKAGLKPLFLVSVIRFKSKSAKADFVCVAATSSRQVLLL